MLHARPGAAHAGWVAERDRASVSRWWQSVIMHDHCTPALRAFAASAPTCSSRPAGACGSPIPWTRRRSDGRSARVMRRGTVQHFCAAGKASRAVCRELACCHSRRASLQSCSSCALLSCALRCASSTFACSVTALARACCNSCAAATSSCAPLAGIPAEEGDSGGGCC